MKNRFVISLCSLALAVAAYGQTPTISPTAPVATPLPTVAPAAVATPTPAISATPSEESDLQRKIENKVKRHLSINFTDNHGRKHELHSKNSDSDDLGNFIAIPIVGIIFSTLFGAPVIIVGMIMFFSYWKARSLHRTVRTMVEKGQPVPAALFVGAPTVIRARSDMRRGVVLIMVGIGIMIFFGAVNDWEGGSWAIGVIPFLIGAGHLLVWKLEGNTPMAINTGTDNPPRVP
ncbi:MAG: DUF6249 domain-containing protein [Chthoniobacterales bacterium]